MLIAILIVKKTKSSLSELEKAAKEMRNIMIE